MDILWICFFNTCLFKLLSVCFERNNTTLRIRFKEHKNELYSFTNNREKARKNQKPDPGETL